MKGIPLVIIERKRLKFMFLAFLALVFLAVILLDVLVIYAQEIDYNRHVLKAGDTIWVNIGDNYCENMRIHDHNGYVFPHLFGKRGCFEKAILLKKTKIGEVSKAYKVAFYYSDSEMLIWERSVIREIPEQGIVILNY